MLSIALQADNEKKALLENFCIAYKNILSKYRLIATQATANHIRRATGLEVDELLAGILGGTKQLERAVMNEEVDILISFEHVDFVNFNASPIHNSVLRLCDYYSIPYATNIATAECLIMSLANGDLDWREEMKK